MIANWSFDPAKLDISDDAQRACDLRFDLDEDHWLSLLEFGTWWVFPIARTFTDHIVGVRLLPNRALQDCPVVKLVGYEAFTLASRPAHLVPRMMLGGALANTDRWNTKRDLPDATWEELARLHEALGGRDQLAGIRWLLNDEQHRDASGRAWEEPAALAQALPSLLAAVDPEQETSEFRAYADAAIQTGRVALPVPDFGAWTACAASIAFVNASLPRHGYPMEEQLQAAWSVVQQPPGLDSFHIGVPSHLAQPIGRSQEGVPRLAAQLLAEQRERVPSDWTTSPLWPAVLASAEQPVYDGVAHLKAARSFIELGDREAGLTCLIASAYWMRVANGEGLADLLQAARILAHDGGWTSMALALDEIAGQAITAAPSLA